MLTIDEISIPSDVGFGPFRWIPLLPARAAFAAGIETARQMALTAAMTIETRKGSRIVRDQAAVAALQGLVDGLKVAFLDPPPAADPV